MYTPVKRNDRRLKRANRGRATLLGTSARPRLSVFRSLKGMYVQLIDDAERVTIVGASDKPFSGTPTEKSKQLGEKIAALAKEKKITDVIFDRSGYKYHGRVVALAQAARDGGLIF